MARKRSVSGKKKRTLSPEQLAKMKAGRERKQKHNERVKDLAELEQRLRIGASKK